MALALHCQKPARTGARIAALVAVIATAVASAGPAVVAKGRAATAGLVAAYAFDEGAGTTVADASGNGNTGTISGAAWASAGRFGRALSFDGSTNWVTVTDSPSL